MINFIKQFANEIAVFFAGMGLAGLMSWTAVGTILVVLTFVVANKVKG